VSGACRGAAGTRYSATSGQHQHQAYGRAGADFGGNTTVRKDAGKGSGPKKSDASWGHAPIRIKNGTDSAAQQAGGFRESIQGNAMEGQENRWDTRISTTSIKHSAVKSGRDFIPSRRGRECASGLWRGRPAGHCGPPRHPGGAPSISSAQAQSQKRTRLIGICHGHAGNRRARLTGAAERRKLAGTFGRKKNKKLLRPSGRRGRPFGPGRRGKLERRAGAMMEIGRGPKNGRKNRAESSIGCQTPPTGPSGKIKKATPLARRAGKAEEVARPKRPLPRARGPTGVPGKIRCRGRATPNE